MPGRRGQGEDLDRLLLPLSFRDYVAVKSPGTVERLAGISLSEPLDEVRRSAEGTVVHDVVLAAEFQRYLATGGFLNAAAREVSEARIGTALYLQHRDAFIGEVIRTGHRESYFRELVRWLFPRLGAEFSWRDLAAETEIGAHATARAYVEDLEELFLWHVFHRVKTPERPRPAFKSPKKLYPGDPFTYHTLFAWGRGLPDPWLSTREVLGDPALTGRLVESIVADHLRRLFGRNCFYYRSPGGEEIDFVCWRGAGSPTVIEVKWRGRLGARDWQALSARGGGLLLTRDRLSVLSHRPPVLAVPAHVALALLEAPTLKAVGFAD
jgi:predicted AAA+ superfamily ATPase